MEIQEIEKPSYKIRLRKSGRLISITTPDGGTISNIVSDSIGFYCDELPLKALNIQKLKLEIYINDSDIIIVQDE